MMSSKRKRRVLLVCCRNMPNSSFLSSFFHIHDRSYFVRFEGKRAERMAHHILNRKHLIISTQPYLNNYDSEQSVTPASLIEIYKFDERVKQLERRNDDKILVFSAGGSVESQCRVAFLIGCHLIMSKSLDANAVYHIFERLDEVWSPKIHQKFSIMDCWQALHHAKSLAWLDFSEQIVPDSDEGSAINMEEFIHYSR